MIKYNNKEYNNRKELLKDYNSHNLSYECLNKRIQNGYTKGFGI